MTGLLVLGVGTCTHFVMRGGDSDQHPVTAQADTPDVPVATPTAQQILDARLALCIGASWALDDIKKGERPGDPILIANKLDVGKKAGGATIGHEWFAYKGGEWHDSDCHSLSRAKWAFAEGAGGDPIDLPAGTIGRVTPQ